MAVVDGFDVDMGTVGEALRLRELVDLAYDGLAKLLQGERDDAAAKARAAACERRVVGDGAHSDPWATRLPSNARPAAVASRTCKRGHRWIWTRSARQLWGNFGIKDRSRQESQGLDLVDEILENRAASRRPTANRAASRPVDRQRTDLIRGPCQA